ncbi:unconventional prefoldin RPB5 interactor 1 [Neosynchiropus ocellatus]
MAGNGNTDVDRLAWIARLREEHEKVVKDCDNRIQHWKKVSGDYEALNDRLSTLPDKLSYDIMVPFGPLAFMPGKLVHTNEVTVLLGDNWFAQCSAKQAQKIVDHRLNYVKKEVDGLLKTKKNFEARVGMTKDWETDTKDDYVDIREDVQNSDIVSNKGKQRIAHKPNSKPKLDAVLDLEEEEEKDDENGIMSVEELWARLDELEKQEKLEDERERLLDNGGANGEDVSSSSSEEEKERESSSAVNGLSLKPSWSLVSNSEVSRDGDIKEQVQDGDDADCLPTIYFSHTGEPKKVRINTGKNTTLKFSERKEQKEHSKKKKKNGHSNGHHEHHRIVTPADIYRLFVDVRNGEPVPRKSILKSRSRENSVCSDTSESSAADFEERRMAVRSFSHDEATHSDTSDGITEEDSPTAMPLLPTSRFEAFSGTVVEKEPMPTTVPHLTISPPALPTILERKQEELASDAAPPQQPTKRVSKFKASRLQQK